MGVEWEMQLIYGCGGVVELEWGNRGERGWWCNIGSRGIYGSRDGWWFKY